MPRHAPKELQTQIDALSQPGPERATKLVDAILRDAAQRGASDVHLEPTHNAVEIRYRLDGVLHRMAAVDRDVGPNLVGRLKVLAELLTYRVDIPQEGSIREAAGGFGVEMRVSTFPTIHGEKVVVRLYDPSGRVLDLDELGLDLELLGTLNAVFRERTGAVLLTGPSGSGKTTTIYACLRHLVRTGSGGRHIVTIEDPVEQALEGVSQSQARPGTEFDFARGLRSLLRQDPEVILIGEIRDAETAAIAIQASLTGHLVFSTLHAGSACGVIGRLLDMGVEPYLLTSGLRAVLNQRLVRKVCQACRAEPAAIADCEWCAATGYRGRFLLAELLTLDDALRQAIVARADTGTLERLANRDSRQTLRSAADRAVADGLTTVLEIERAVGPH